MTFDDSDEKFAVMRRGVTAVLEDDNSGHDMGHIDRVIALAERFCDELDQDVDAEVVRYAALLHEVDDYKIVGKEKSGEYANMSKIMSDAGLNLEVQDRVREIVSTMGYSKSLRGIRPKSIEGWVVSDADMCEAIGASGTLRAFQYAISDKGSGVIFDKNIWPEVDISAETYNSSGTTHSTDSFVNHHFEKLLKLKGMMLTEPGKREAGRRHVTMREFLQAFFVEQNAPEWEKFLEIFEKERNSAT